MARARRLSIHTPKRTCNAFKKPVCLIHNAVWMFLFHFHLFLFPRPVTLLFCKCRENPLPM